MIKAAIGSSTNRDPTADEAGDNGWMEEGMGVLPLIDVFYWQQLQKATSNDCRREKHKFCSNLCYGLLTVCGDVTSGLVPVMTSPLVLEIWCVGTLRL